ncbi:MAG TPA: trypsin-like peptidase domain-containing protein [Spirochaetia bacterium]|nr:trypsin-like peptidase domain-containing protein [Spirochaetia bacterium]
MANTLKELSGSLREAIRRASAYTVGLEREPYAVSGVLIGGGKVLTASHLVPDEGITVIMPDGKKADAKVAGRDAIHDLVLLRLDSAGQTAPPAAAAVEVGDLVVSLKRDTFDGINASLAMVSAQGSKLRLGRNGILERYLQTDTDRLPGTTGGPLADSEGAFAGIQVFNRRMGAEVAIPADVALARAKLLEEKGSVQRPYLGVRSQSVALPKDVRTSLKDRQETGLLLVSVDGGSAAEKAGLVVGDILVGFAGKPVANHEELVTLMAESGAGAKVDVEIIRGAALRTVSLSIGGI